MRDSSRFVNFPFTAFVKNIDVAQQAVLQTIDN